MRASRVAWVALLCVAVSFGVLGASDSSVAEEPITAKPVNDASNRSTSACGRKPSHSRGSGHGTHRRYVLVHAVGGRALAPGTVAVHRTWSGPRFTN